MPNPNQEQLNNWRQRAFNLLVDMEEVNGERGGNYPPPWQCAMYVTTTEILAEISRQESALLSTGSRGGDA